jgi:cytochrome c-type biogenesis protein
VPNVPVLAAAAAGTLSFLSPCVLPLVPPYLVYLTGTSLERFAEAEPKPRVRRDTLAAALLFVLGFSTVFVALGASASAIGGVLRAYSSGLAILAGIAIIVMGLHFLGLTPIAWLMREKRLTVAKPVGLWGAYLMGLAFALGWTPCIGPVLAAILAVAAAEATVVKGAGLLARARRSVRYRGARGGTLRGVSRTLPYPSRPCREGHGRIAGAHRYCLSYRRDQRGELLVVGHVSIAGQDRLEHDPEKRVRVFGKDHAQTTR